MARKWTQKEEEIYYNELYDLYVVKNKTIGEISKILSIEQSSVHKRLIRLSIDTSPETKKHYLNKRTDIKIPKKYSKNLAEVIGILLGDGSLSHFQIVVTLGDKEFSYAKYVQDLMNKVFKADAKIGKRKTGYNDVYFGSVDISLWLQEQGLVFNKIKGQVDVPKWIFSNKEYMKMCLRGFFDTDGSVYKIRYGVQISFTNFSLPLLKSLQSMLLRLQYSPSCISSHKVYLTKVYLTKKEDVQRFFREIHPKNKKHIKRFENINASVV